MFEASKRDLDLEIDIHCRFLEIGRSEFLARVKDACNRKRAFYFILAAQREEWKRHQDSWMSKMAERAAERAEA